MTVHVQRQAADCSAKELRVSAGTRAGVTEGIQRLDLEHGSGAQQGDVLDVDSDAYLLLIEKPMEHHSQVMLQPGGRILNEPSRHTGFWGCRKPTDAVPADDCAWLRDHEP